MIETNTSTELTFGKHPVEIEVIDSDIHIKCKGVEGKFSQVEKYLLQTKGHSINYKFSDSNIIQTEEGYKIACLRGTYEEAEKIISYCNHLKTKIKQNGKYPK